jgi:hypothetical protein
MPAGDIPGEDGGASGQKCPASLSGPGFLGRLSLDPVSSKRLFLPLKLPRPQASADAQPRRLEDKLAKLCTTAHHPLGKSNEPVYTITDGKFYRTVFHPSGWSALADYELGPDGKLYRTASHPLGPGKAAAYEFRGDCGLYRTAGHPQGASDLPEYELCD